MSYTVRITDDSGALVAELVVEDDVATRSGSNYDQAVAEGYVEDSLAGRILLALAPEVCPFDCSRCNE